MSTRITLRKVLGWLVFAVLTLLTLVLTAFSAAFSGLGDAFQVLLVLWFLFALYYAIGSA